MDLQLTGRRALVTGSSGGIGEAVAYRLAQEGVEVIVHGRRKDAVDRVVAAISTVGRASGVTGDLRNDDGPTTLATAALTGGGVDILVNNGGSYANRGWDDTTPQEWLDLYRVNVVAAVRLIQLLVPAMRTRGWGRIIQLGTGEATAPFATMPDYAASKAALVNLTVSLAKHLAGTGITVNTVSPGIIVTHGVEAFYRQEAVRHGWGDDWAEIEAHVLRDVLDVPVGRLGRPSEIADLVTFLASPRADYINGANYRIDGGSIGTVN
ncbi:MAG TPA: SDR family NAD(P)-dependent oxidoreductase [Kribbellaceae bacterium]|nr:SDR family NAD(P)-dependent oxidoreductase [Kribbellaceae bacterium]